MRAGWVLPTVRGYHRSWLRADLLAGLTLAAVALPAQIATARLAGLPAVAGLDAFVAGTLLYALLGPERHVSVGADSTIAPVLAAGVAGLAAAGTPHYDALMAVTALLVGAVLVAVGLLRLGWISEFLSTPVIVGVLAGIAVQILVRQLPVVLGVGGGGTTTVGRLRAVAGELGHVNGWSLGVALVVLAVIVVAQRIDHRVPGALLALVGSLVAADALGLGSRHGVALLGVVHGGLPSFRLPSASWPQVRRLTGTVLTVSFICIAQTAATVRQRSAGAPATADFNRELIALGAGSVGAGLLGSMAVNASPPNTAILTASGARSQVAAATAAVLVLVVAATAAGSLAHLPAATLGATLIFVASKLFRGAEFGRILRFDRIEFALAATSALIVALIGIQQGVVLAAFLTLAERTRRSARPRDAVLGREPGTDHWIPADSGYPTETLPGIIVYLVYAPIWYGNADYVRLRISDLVGAASDPVRALIIDADAISDIDYTGMQALRDLVLALAARQVSVEMARASHLVHHNLRHGAIDDLLGPEHLFASVAEAVAAVLHRP